MDLAWPVCSCLSIICLVSITTIIGIKRPGFFNILNGEKIVFFEKLALKFAQRTVKISTHGDMFTKLENPH